MSSLISLMQRGGPERSGDIRPYTVDHTRDGHVTVEIIHELYIHSTLTPVIIIWRYPSRLLFTHRPFTPCYYITGKIHV